MIKGFVLAYVPPLAMLWIGFAFGGEWMLNQWWSLPAFATAVVGCFSWAAFCGWHFS